jgi:predicted dehydrogenase
VGERGSLIADFTQSTVTVTAGAHVRRADGWDAVEIGKEVLDVGGGEPLALELAAFLAAVRRRGPSPVDVAAGLRALETVEGAVLSSRLGRRVSLDELRDGPPGSAYSLGPEALTV